MLTLEKTMTQTKDPTQIFTQTSLNKKCGDEIIMNVDIDEHNEPYHEPRPQSISNMPKQKLVMTNK
jgi:hypothetical protein